MPKIAKNIRNLRDLRARHAVKNSEIVRRAYIYVARNQSLPAHVRYQAQLQLNTFANNTRPTTVNNRCTESGRGRGIISEFGLCRVRDIVSSRIGEFCLIFLAVPIPPEGAEQRTPRRSQSILVASLIGTDLVYVSLSFSLPHYLTTGISAM